MVILALSEETSVYFLCIEVNPALVLWITTDYQLIYEKFSCDWDYFAGFQVICGVVHLGLRDHINTCVFGSGLADYSNLIKDCFLHVKKYAF